jgi:exodeoxyribonuclease VII large subunit
VINHQLARINARVRGEIIQFKLQGSALYATLKDIDDSSVLSLFMWASDYELSGIELAEGLEVIVQGRSDVYKPSGRLSFRAETIELVGEGALKKSYEELKSKMTAEGIFTEERKRSLPEFPTRIGVITSRSGAVIHDFLTNLGKFGFRVSLYDSRVEGIAAVKELLSGMKYFASKEIDVLVVIRGGGSLESLQAFNNEHVVRAIASFPKPVICAIGHDKDVPLAQLAADLSPSTPTAATSLLNQTWEEAIHVVRYFSKDIFRLYSDQIWMIRDTLRSDEKILVNEFKHIADIFLGITRSFQEIIGRLRGAMNSVGSEIKDITTALPFAYHRSLTLYSGTLLEMSKLLNVHNPLRQLKLGYSLLIRGGKLVRSVNELPSGAEFEARLSDGTISAIAKDHS